MNDEHQDCNECKWLSVAAYNEIFLKGKLSISEAISLEYELRELATAENIDFCKIESDRPDGVLQEFLYPAKLFEMLFLLVEV
jgi:hypothetical protein